MKLRNKRTGEIAVFSEGIVDLRQIGCKNVAEMIATGWEDYEEPKEYYFIRSESLTVGYSPISNTRSCRNRKEIGNYFETKEEAEKAVEKLKAWKRLKDKGFKVDLWDYDGGNYQERIQTGRILFRVKDYEENDKDLDLLFGGEE